MAGKMWCQSEKRARKNGRDVTARYIDSSKSRDPLLWQRNNMAAQGW
jgi:hypothetical protein